MDTPYKHIVTEEDLENYPDVFDETTIVGQEVELSDEEYGMIGMELHTITADEIEEGGKYYGFGFVAGEKIERRIDDIIKEDNEE